MKKRFLSAQMMLNTGQMTVNAVHHENNGRYDLALNYWNQAINSGFNNSEAYTCRGKLKIFCLNQVEDGIKDLDKAISLDDIKYIKLEAYIVRGYAKLKLMKYQEALDDFKRHILESKKTTIRDLCAAYGGSCIAKKYLKLEQGASEDYSMVRELRNLNNVLDLLLRAEAHQLFGNIGAASEDYRRILQLHPKYPPALSALDRIMHPPTAPVEHTPAAHAANASAAPAKPLLPNILKEIKTNYEVNNVAAGEILKKFEQLINEYPNQKEEIILSRANFHFYMANKSTNKAQCEFILQNAQKDYRSVLTINCYNQEAAEGLEKVQSRSLNDPASSSGLDLG